MEEMGRQGKYKEGKLSNESSDQAWSSILGRNFYSNKINVKDVDDS